MIHIHNGDVVAALALRSGIPGEHVAYRESLVTGPIVPGEDWIETRARALAARYNEDLLRTRTSLVEQEQLLGDAASRGEIVLWFEHDLYCLVHLVHLLQRMPADARVSVVWCPKPLGENDDSGLYLLFESRAAVTPAMASVAREVWRAYTSPDPTSLNTWLERDTPDFPFLRQGLTLHASRFPSTRNGLGALEQLALELVATGATDFASLFDALNAREPRFGFGDTEVWQLLQTISWCAVPLLTLNGTPPKALLTITPAGMNVISAEVDNLAVNDPDLWLGGAHLTKENVWRFDGAHLSRQPAS
ncbi:MAG TPA: hypothetical protein VNI54_09375 [Thermoanaerobaculia bacterium]|nr:hypothetical protein [Thermoanaerobaculia bacterium]